MKPSKYQIEKVRVGEVVHIEYTQKERDDRRTVVLDSKDAPKQSLKDALAALTDDVIVLCDLPVGYTKGLDVRGVRFKHLKEGRIGAVISAVKTVEHTSAVFNINTPYAEQAQEDPTKGLEQPAIVRLRQVLKEATAYIEGERLQPSLGLHSRASQN